MTPVPTGMMFASTMEGSCSRPVSGPLGGGILAAAVLLFGLCASPLAAQESSRPDKIVRLNPRTGTVTTMSGTIVANSLDQVRWSNGGREEDFASEQVLEVIWGEVPASFRDGATYMSRGDFANAANMFRMAATDGDAREVVQAAARANVAEALLALGATDPNQFAECITECERFLTDYPSNRQVPHVQWLKARATLLGGDLAGAATLFRAIYDAGATEPPTKGYSRRFSLLAGLDAARAYLAANDTAAARELFTALESGFAGLAAALDGDDHPDRPILAGAQGEAAVGEGLCLLADGDTARAVSFFEERIADSNASPAERYTARLGLARALQAEGRLRGAQIQFARVAALDYTDRDRSAAALVGLADCTIQLGDADAAASARKWLNQVKESYGDTPAAKRAAELLQTL